MNAVTSLLAITTVLEFAGAAVAGGALVLAVGAMRRALARRAQRTRRPALLEAVAARAEGTFSATDERGLAGFYEYHVLLDPARAPVATNIVQYEAHGLSATWFDLERDDDGRRPRRSVVLLDLPAHFGMSHVWLGGRDAPAVSGDAPPGLPWIDFDSEAEFAARFVVASNNPVFARALLSESARGLLMAVPDVELGLAQRSLIVTLARPVELAPDELRQLTAFALDFCTTIPPELATPTTGSSS